jgi:RNA polymerase sigma-70 factor (ECF subfamily)
MADGPQAGLALLDELTLDGYHLLPATRADLLRRLGRHAEAADWYTRARDLAPTEAERAYLTRRISEALSVPAGPVRREGESRPPEESP